MQSSSSWKAPELAEAPSGGSATGCREDPKAYFPPVRNGGCRVQNATIPIDTMGHISHPHGYIGIYWVHWPPPWIHWDTLATSMIHWNTSALWTHQSLHGHIGTHQPPPWIHWDTLATPMIHWNMPALWIHWDTLAMPMDIWRHTNHPTDTLEHTRTPHPMDAPSHISHPHGHTKPHQPPPQTRWDTPAIPKDTPGHTQTLQLTSLPKNPPSLNKTAT